MIKDVELYNALSKGSGKRVLCVCDRCNNEKHVIRANIKNNNYTLCFKCTREENISLKPFKSKFTKDDNFFSIPNPINSYWAGLIAADGCISTTRKIYKSFSLTLIDKDIELLEYLRKDLSFSGNINTNKGYSSIRFAPDLIMLNDLLSNYSITERKSLTLVPPNITD